MIALVLTILAGIAIRKAPLGLPAVITKWGGSILWGVMFWHLTARIRHPATRAAVAFALATASECLKLIHTPMLDRLRANPVGGFLLGHHFALADIAAYAIGIAIAARIAQLRTKSLHPARS